MKTIKRIIEKLKSCFNILTSKQYIISTSDSDFKSGFLTKNLHMYISDGVTPIFVDATISYLNDFKKEPKENFVIQGTVVETASEALQIMKNKSKYIDAKKTPLDSEEIGYFFSYADKNRKVIDKEFGKAIAGISIDEFKNTFEQMKSDGYTFFYKSYC